MERDDWKDAGDYVEVSVPTELVKRVINGVSDIMKDWEAEATSKDQEFNALIGMAAMRIAFDFIETSMENMSTETMQ